MSNGEDQLEFISVTNADDDELMNNTYSDPLIDSDGGNSNVIGGWMFTQSKHPVTIFFHLLFKSLAIFLYVFSSWFTDNFIFTFVLCIILLAFDFWTVKNVSGRLLVGLRWWSYVKDDGETDWIFESLEDMAEISAVDSRMFWGGLYCSVIAWSLLLVVGVLRLKFSYLPLVIVALVLNIANIIGYFKCSSKAKEKMQSMVENSMRSSSMAALENSAFRNWVMSSLLAVAENSAKTPAAAQSGGNQA